MNDKMTISVLASSSSGNATFVGTNKVQLLIDAGLSGRKIERLLQSIGKSASALDAILVTHEHSDHCKGVGVLARRYGLAVYANHKTWAAMAHTVGQIDASQRFLFETNQTKTIGDIDVESYAVAHDAADPQFFAVHHNNKSFATLTDTGVVDDQLAGTIRNYDGYLFECNHDENLLVAGKYPWAVKRRIMSNLGHLSNDEAAGAMMDVLGINTKRIYLGHLSQHNNTKELAHLSVQAKMQQNGLAVGSDFALVDTDPNLANDVWQL